VQPYLDSTTEKITELHGGRVEAHSAGSGRGSEFIVRLPALSPVTEALIPLETVQQPMPTARVLAVDDNRDSADMLVLMLQTFGYEAQAAYDGQTALEMAVQYHPDFVFLDIGLPKMDGYEVAQRLRQHPQTKEIWIIALTGYGQESDRQRTQKAGFNYHLVKPVNSWKLRELLATLTK
jgi:CheY-like chemotaxis protein